MKNMNKIAVNIPDLCYRGDFEIFTRDNIDTGEICNIELFGKGLKLVKSEAAVEMTLFEQDTIE